MATPDLQLHFVPALLMHGTDVRKLGHGYSCHVCVLRPKSRGEVRLRSADMREAPVIDPRFLSHEDDVRDMVAGVKAVRRIFRQSALAGLGGRDLLTDDFGAGDSNDVAIEQYVRQYSDTVYHPVGTCKMGKDPMAVVDTALRVHGVEGLRVADASVMPSLVSGNTNVPAMVIGERAADLLRAA
jgi:choline dehydrogenase-like flavoprotein